MADMFPRARVRRQILLALDGGPAESITSLAKTIEVSRPSASRALHALESTGLAISRGRSWELTELGREETKRVRVEVRRTVTTTGVEISRLLEKQERLERVAGTIFQDSAAKSLGALTSSHQRSLESLNRTIKGQQEQLARSGILRAMEGAQNQLRQFEQFGSSTAAAGAKLQSMLDYSGATAASLRALEQAQSEIKRSGVVDMVAAAYRDFDRTASAAAIAASTIAAKQIAEWESAHRGLLRSAAAMSTAQIRAATWLGAGEALSESLRRNLVGYNTSVAETLADLSAMAERPLGSGKAMLATNAAAVACSVEIYVRDYSGRFGAGGKIGSMAEATLAQTVTIPAASSASLIRSMRQVIEDRDEAAFHAIPMLDASGVPSLETMILDVGGAVGQLAPRFVRMWDGAWETLASRNPNRLSLAAHGGRELIRQMLEHMAPDSCFSLEEIQREGHEGKVTRRMRAKRILGSKSAAKWADKMAGAYDSAYNYLSGEAHNEDEAPQLTDGQIAGLLYAAGGLALFAIHSPRPNELELQD